jgi:hypothetical protein
MYRPAFLFAGVFGSSDNRTITFTKTTTTTMVEMMKIILKWQESPEQILNFLLLHL